MDLHRIPTDPEILSGTPCVRGTRLSVEFILELIASGASRDEITRAYPRLTTADVEAAVRFGVQSLRLLPTHDA